MSAGQTLVLSAVRKQTTMKMMLTRKTAAKARTAEVKVRKSRRRWGRDHKSSTQPHTREGVGELEPHLQRRTPQALLLTYLLRKVGPLRRFR